jgi:hypothetical protein
MTSYGGADRALTVYIADDGSSTNRLHIIRYDKTQNPLAPDFGAPVKFDANTGAVVDAKIRMDASGDGLLVWTQNSGSLPRLFASIYNGQNDVFSFPRAIDYAVIGENPTPDGVVDFDMALGKNGNGIISFSENNGGVWEAYGVYFNKTLGTFNPPEIVNLFPSLPDHNITSLQAVAGPPGSGGISFLQDTDATGGVNCCCGGSKFTSESSLSSFSAPISVNEDGGGAPPFDNDVRRFNLSCLPNGNLLWLMEMDDLAGVSRVYYRRMNNLLNFEEATPLDTGPMDSTHEFTYPLLAADSLGNAVALFLRGSPANPALYCNYYSAQSEAFLTAGPYRVSAGTGAGEVKPGFAMGYSAQGDGLAVYAETVDTPTGPAQSLWALHLPSGIQAFSSPFRADKGIVETSEIATLPMTFSTPKITGVTFGATGQAHVSFTLSDGRLSRLYLNHIDPGNPLSFLGVRPVDNSWRNSVFSQTSDIVIDQVEPGSGHFFAHPSDGTGFVLMLKRRTVGSTIDNVRLWGNTYHGYNMPPDTTVGPAIMVDTFLDSSQPRNVSDFAVATAADGTGLLAFVQNDGGTDELYLRSFAAGGLFGDVSATMDNATATTPGNLAVLMSDLGTGFVAFLQDSGLGALHLYVRRFNGGVFSYVGTTLTPGANEPLSMPGASGYGQVASFAWALDSAGRACIAFKQAKPSGVGIFTVRVNLDGSLEGPREISSTGLTQVSNPLLAVNGADAVLVVHTEGTPADLKSNFWISSALYASLAGPVGADVESAAPAVGGFVLAAGKADFLAAFEQDDGTGAAVFARRFLTGGAAPAWNVSAPTQLKGPTTPTMTWTTPRVVLDEADRGVVLFFENQTGASPTINLLASALEPDGTFTSPVYVDMDGSAAGYAVVDAKMTLHPASGHGVIAFTQLDDSTFSKIYTRGFHLGNAGTTTAIFESHASDRNEGGSVVTTDVVFYDICIDRYGKGMLVHSELDNPGADPNDTRVFLFGRPFDANTGSFGPSHLACRMLHIGTLGSGAGSDAEGCSNAALSADAQGNFTLIHLLSQNHQTNGLRERLFASGITMR